MDPDVNENVRTTFTYRRLFYIRITSFIWGKLFLNEKEIELKRSENESGKKLGHPNENDDV